MDTCLGNSRPYLLGVKSQHIFLPFAIDDGAAFLSQRNSPFPTRLKDYGSEALRQLLDRRHGNLQQAGVGLLQRLEIIFLDVCYAILPSARIFRSACMAA